MEQENKVKSFLSFDNLSAWILMLGLFLLPIFNLPWWGVSLGVSKMMLITILTVTAFVLWLLSRLQTGQVAIPKNYVIVSALGVALVSLLSALYSNSFSSSFLGIGFELDTFIAIFTLVILLILFGVHFQTRQRFLSAYMIVFGVFVLFLILEVLAVLVLRFSFFPAWQSFFSIWFNNLYTVLIGKWYDLGVYAGFVTVSSLVFLELFGLKRMPLFKFFIFFCYILSLILVAFVNYWLV
ncbi:MAG: hypothetical protein NTV48_03500, partial [Candidatus Vogelbacteria bacterium]|nr:hypothetical protein [Candidatus Vogelbacteria bacterium]